MMELQGDKSGGAQTEATEQVGGRVRMCTVLGNRFGRLSKKDLQIKSLKSSERQLEKIRAKAALRMRLLVWGASITVELSFRHGIHLLRADQELRFFKNRSKAELHFVRLVSMRSSCMCKTAHLMCTTLRFAGNLMLPGLIWIGTHWFAKLTFVAMPRALRGKRCKLALASNTTTALILVLTFAECNPQRSHLSYADTATSQHQVLLYSFSWVGSHLRATAWTR